MCSFLGPPGQVLMRRLDLRSLPASVSPCTLRGLWRARGAIPLVGPCCNHSWCLFHLPSDTVLFFSECFDGFPLCPPITVSSLVSRASRRTWGLGSVLGPGLIPPVQRHFPPFKSAFPSRVVQTSHSPQGVLCGEPLWCSVFISVAFLPANLSSHAGTTDHNCLTGLSTCCCSLLHPCSLGITDRTCVIFLFRSPPCSWPFPLVQVLTHSPGPPQTLPASGLLKEQ